MSNDQFTAFQGTSILARGSKARVAHALHDLGHGPHPADVLVFSDETGRETDLDLSGSASDIAARYTATDQPEPARRGRGRPKLGVKAKEVTLLPRHWDWLASQPGGASATLRRLIDAARADAPPSPDPAYRFAASMAGNLPGYEDAMRHLFAHDGPALRDAIRDWPVDIREYFAKLAGLNAQDP
ncbi:MAG: DUF2239 family protein [Pseudooceanicola atlanticus]